MQPHVEARALNSSFERDVGAQRPCCLQPSYRVCGERLAGKLLEEFSLALEQ